MKSRFSIKFKIILIVSMFLFLLLVSSMIGFLGTRSAQRNYDNVIETNLPVSTLVKDIRSLTLEQVAAVRGYMIYHDESYIKLFDDINAQVLEEFEKISAKITTQESKDFLKQLETEHDLYKQGALEVLDLASNGNMDEAISKGEEVRPYVNEIKSITNEWSLWVEKTNHDIIEQVDTVAETNRAILVGVFIFSLLAGLLIAVYFILGIARPIKKITEAALLISKGDLTGDIPVIKSKDEIRDLGDSFSTMKGNIRALISDVNLVSQDMVASSEELSASSEQVANSSEQIAIAVSELAKGASDQAVSAEKSNDKIGGIVQGFEKIASDMSKSNKMSVDAKNIVLKGEISVKTQEMKVVENKEVTTDVSSAITNLSYKSNEIGLILDVIRGIAEQTNLLALNAAIEAARAGEHGKGFSVVADEIRKLSEMSRESVNQISTIIFEVQNNVEETVEKMNKSVVLAEEQSQAISETINDFNEIKNIVNEIAAVVDAVYNDSIVLTRNAEIAGDAIAEIASITEETAAGTQELAASTEEQTSVNQQVSGSAVDLANLATKLQDSIQLFTV